MINEIAFTQFKVIWELFDRKIIELGGSPFLIDPLRQYYPIEYPKTMSLEETRITFFNKLNAWGEIHRLKPELITLGEFTFKDGNKIEFKDFKDPQLKESRIFIINSFYNLCCLTMYRTTIEELIYWANKDETCENIPKHKNTDSFCKLIKLNDAFLLADWSYNILFGAISSKNEYFFKKLAKSLNQRIPEKRFDTARTWLGTILLWYLGGKEMKRRDFMLFLKEHKILQTDMEELSFNAMLSNLRLTKKLTI